MPGQRKAGKTKVNLWMTEEEKQRLQDTAAELGFATLTDFLKWIAETGGKELRSTKPPRG